MHVFSGCCIKDQYGRVQLYYLVITNSSIAIEGCIISKKLAVKVRLMSTCTVSSMRIVMRTQSHRQKNQGSGKLATDRDSSVMVV